MLHKNIMLMDLSLCSSLKHHDKTLKMIHFTRMVVRRFYTIRADFYHELLVKRRM